MRLQQWGGLFTNASPYAIPAGGAVGQINLTCSTMGQLTVRDGMRPVAFANGTAASCLDVAGYSHNGQHKVLVFDSSGLLSVLDAPEYGTASGAPYHPPLSWTGTETNVGYDYRWNDDNGNAYPPSQLYDGIFGGYPSTTSWPGHVNANEYCGGTCVDSWNGGTPYTTDYPDALQYGRDICP